MNDTTSNPHSKQTAMLSAIALCTAAALATLSGCQTVRGLGEDITYASDKTAEAISGEKHPRED